MFNSLKNLESSFRQIKRFAILYTFFIGIICLYVIWSSYQSAQKAREKIYVLDQGKSLILALEQDINQNRPAEARDHVKRFHELFFTIPPDPQVIKRNIERAFFLCDESVEKEYKRLEREKFYSQIVNRKVRQEITVDSVDVKFEQYPYYAKTYARQKIIYPSRTIEKNLISENWLSNVPRSDNNPHGFLIEKWKVLNNDEISSSER